MKSTYYFLFLTLTFSLLITSCISKSEHEALLASYDIAKKDLAQNNIDLKEQTRLYQQCDQELKGLMNQNSSALSLREEQIADLKEQIADLRRSRDQTVEQVGDLTVLSQSANENIKETLGQLESKDKYIHLLQAAKTKTDSVNLALAVNLKDVLEDGIEDSDIEISVDKTVVFINLSDKMLYSSGSSTITARADEVLAKIAQIVKSRPDVEVMVEGHTDNLPISRACFEDNWDLSVKRASSVVRALQTKFGVEPHRLIAAGRAEYLPLTTNDSSAGRSINRRTRIMIMPKIDQFYDLLNPSNVPD